MAESSGRLAYNRDLNGLSLLRTTRTDADVDDFVFVFPQLVFVQRYDAAYAVRVAFEDRLDGCPLVRSLVLPTCPLSISIGEVTCRMKEGLGVHRYVHHAVAGRVPRQLCAIRARLVGELYAVLFDICGHTTTISLYASLQVLEEGVLWFIKIQHKQAAFEWSLSGTSANGKHFPDYLLNQVVYSENGWSFFIKLNRANT